jgi:hypothetical protein
MLSPKTILRIFLSLVLIIVFYAGPNELRISIATLLSWVIGLIAHQHLSLSPRFLRNHILFILLSWWLLAATNTLFYECTFGRCLDIFFARCKYDPETPGSGFTDWHEHFARRHRDDITFAWDFLYFALWSTLGFVSLPFVIAFGHWYAALPRQIPSITSAIEYLNETGEYAPWLAKQQVPLPPPKRDTRYVRLSDDVVFVCGRGGGFERVVAGDYDGAISRRRGLSKEFA